MEDLKRSLIPGSPNLDHLKCPLCQDLLGVRILSCRFCGVSYCTPCLVQAFEVDQKCPHSGCLLTHLPVPNIALQNLVGSFRFNCPFQNDGCDETNMDRMAVEAHRDQCQFNSARETDFCQRMGIGCQHRSPANSLHALMEHLRNNHIQIIAKSLRERDGVLLASNFYLKLRPGLIRVKPILFQEGGTHVVMLGQANRSQVSVFLFQTPTVELQCGFTLKAQLEVMSQLRRFNQKPVGESFHVKTFSQLADFREGPRNLDEEARYCCPLNETVLRDMQDYGLNLAFLTLRIFQAANA